jgi:hypothetical protein
MQRTNWAVALGLVLGVPLPAGAEIIKGRIAVHGAEMS